MTTFRIYYVLIHQLLYFRWLGPFWRWYPCIASNSSKFIYLELIYKQNMKRGIYARPATFRPGLFFAKVFLPYSRFHLGINTSIPRCDICAKIRLFNPHHRLVFDRLHIKISENEDAWTSLKGFMGTIVLMNIRWSRRKKRRQCFRRRNYLLSVRY